MPNADPGSPGGRLVPLAPQGRLCSSRLGWGRQSPRAPSPRKTTDKAPPAGATRRSRASRNTSGKDHLSPKIHVCVLVTIFYWAEGRTRSS